ncbi:MAG: flagellar type III secretion system pore protein FliP, partial [Actinobacteria bacterium]|nr:flagellar type III secretion system pore protein FliP [Actinomycetota bacterium]
VLVGLALFLTFFVMSPILGQVNEDAIQPLLAGEIEQNEAFALGYEPLRDFMLAQTREDDLQLFIDLAVAEQPASREDIGATTLIPAFVISELRTAFIIGFVIFVPFLVIDLVVSAVLMSMGMMMLPPVFISMPLKLLLFVLVDGWALVVGSLVASVNGVG